MSRDEQSHPRTLLRTPGRHLCVTTSSLFIGQPVLGFRSAPSTGTTRSHCRCLVLGVRRLVLGVRRLVLAHTSGVGAELDVGVVGKVVGRGGIALRACRLANSESSPCCNGSVLVGGVVEEGEVDISCFVGLAVSGSRGSSLSVTFVGRSWSDVLSGLCWCSNLFVTVAPSSVLLSDSRMSRVQSLLGEAVVGGGIQHSDHAVLAVVGAWGGGSSGSVAASWACRLANGELSPCCVFVVVVAVEVESEMQSLLGCTLVVGSAL